MPRMKKIFLLTLCLLGVQMVKAQNQDNRVITTGVPFLLIAADARAAGMGDQGVATSPDVFSQQWNPAKYAFALKQPFSISLATSVWLLRAVFVISDLVISSFVMTLQKKLW
jgi:hypothetical protein